MKRIKNLEHPVVKVSKLLGLTYKELAEQIGYTENGLKNAVAKNQITDQLKKTLELLVRVVLLESFLDSNHLKYLRNNLERDITILKSFEKEVEKLNTAYPILTESFKIAQDKKEQYLQKLNELKEVGRLPITLSKFGKSVWPHLNAKEVEKLLIDDIVLDDKGQNIVDIIAKD